MTRKLLSWSFFFRATNSVTARRFKLERFPWGCFRLLLPVVRAETALILLRWFVSAKAPNSATFSLSGFSLGTDSASWTRDCSRNKTEQDENDLLLIWCWNILGFSINLGSAGKCQGFHALTAVTKENPLNLWRKGLLVWSETAMRETEACSKFSVLFKKNYTMFQQKGCPLALTFIVALKTEYQIPQFLNFAPNTLSRIHVF